VTNRKSLGIDGELDGLLWCVVVLKGGVASLCRVLTEPNSTCERGRVSELREAEESLHTLMHDRVKISGTFYYIIYNQFIHLT
jgi:hypothetical protein